MPQIEASTQTETGATNPETRKPDEVKIAQVKKTYGEILKKLDLVKFDFNNPPAPEPPVMWINGVEVAHPGNLVAIEGGNKAGKSACYGAALAAIIGNNTGDCLGWESDGNPENKAVIHLDSEQSRGDHYNLISNTLSRVKVSEKPEWFSSHCLTAWDLESAGKSIPALLEMAVATYGGVHSLWLDGGADFVLSLNEEKEAFAWVRTMHEFAIKFKCPIFIILHLNPSSPRGGGDKSRGHLGSQLNRKAETVLMVSKDSEEVSSVSTHYARRAPITADNGPSFAFDAEEGMHMSVANRGDEKFNQKRENLIFLAQEVFRDSTPVGMRWTDMASIIEKTTSIDGKKLSKNTTRRRINAMVKASVIKKIKGNYVLIKAEDLPSTLKQPSLDLPEG